MKKYMKYASKGFIAIFTYLFLSMIQSLPFIIFNVDINNISVISKLIYSLFYEILIVSLLLIIYNKLIISNFNDLKKNHKEYYSKNIKYWLLGLIVMYVSNFIIIYGFKNGSMGDNEETIRHLFDINPIFIYISAVIIAPLTEELVFRQSLKDITQNKYLFVILSGLLFGFAHVGFGFESLADLLFIIPYGSLGCAFAIMLNKTNNIFVPMGFHLMHNGILVALQFFILIFG